MIDATSFSPETVPAMSGTPTSDDAPRAIAEGTSAGNVPLATDDARPIVPIEEVASAPIASEVDDNDPANEASLVAWEHDERIVPDVTTESEPSEASGPAERPSQSKFFADAEARRLSRIKR